MISLQKKHKQKTLKVFLIKKKDIYLNFLLNWSNEKISLFLTLAILLFVWKNWIALNDLFFKYLLKKRSINYKFVDYFSFIDFWFINKSIFNPPTNAPNSISFDEVQLWVCEIIFSIIFIALMFLLPKKYLEIIFNALFKDVSKINSQGVKKVETVKIPTQFLLNFFGVFKPTITTLKS